MTGRRADLRGRLAPALVARLEALRAVRWGRRGCASPPPYLFAQLERKIADKRAEGVDIISLGIGDPDTLTPDLVAQAMREHVGRADAPVPSNRGRVVPRGHRAFYATHFGRRARPPDTEIIPARRQGGDRQHQSGFTPPRRSRPWPATPATWLYTNGPIIAGAEPRYRCRSSRSWGSSTTGCDPCRGATTGGPVMSSTTPTTWTGAVSEDDFFCVVDFARRHDIIVVHDNAHLRDHIRRLSRALVSRDTRRQRSSGSRSVLTSLKTYNPDFGWEVGRSHWQRLDLAGA